MNKTRGVPAEAYPLYNERMYECDAKRSWDLNIFRTELSSNKMKRARTRKDEQHASASSAPVFPGYSPTQAKMACVWKSPKKSTFGYARHHLPFSGSSHISCACGTQERDCGLQVIVEESLFLRAQIAYCSTCGLFCIIKVFTWVLLNLDRYVKDRPISLFLIIIHPFNRPYFATNKHKYLLLSPET